MSQLASTGAVLGIDVGFSAKRRTTCLCLLEWDPSAIDLEFCITGSAAGDRAAAIGELVRGRELVGVALDGPLTRGLGLVRHYRVAEAILSRGVLQRRCKPGQTSAPTGQKLHAHATSLAEQALSSVSIAASNHWEPIHQRRIVEAFPNAFLAALIDEEDLPLLARNASDRYWEVLVERSNGIERVFRHLLPAADLRFNLTQCTNHEKRAGIICALTALCVSSGEHVAIGDPIDGDIMLSAHSTWGMGRQRLGSWLEPVLRSNVRAARVARGNHRQGRVASVAGVWFS